LDPAELQATRKPIKERCRREPQGAGDPARRGAAREQEIACSIATGRALVQAGPHPATGGSGTLACSGDMLLQALVACAGVTLRSIATSLKFR